MKKVFLAMAAVAMLFVGCSKEKEDTKPTDDTFTVAKVNCTYKLLVDTPDPAALRKAYDLFIDFYDNDGNVQATQEFVSSDFQWRMDVVQTTFPSWCGFRFRFSPKANLNDVDSTASFSFTATYSVEGVCTGTNGTTKLFGSEGVLEKSGVTPYVETSYGKSLRIRIKTDGAEDGFEPWEN
jgi:hypothetical protein